MAVTAQQIPPAAPRTGIEDEQELFRGHPQPPADHRLKQARIFLADEDINRNLNFKQKLAEIDEYLSYIKSAKLNHNAFLFQDVKTMVDVHKDWISRMDRPPADLTCDNTPAIQNYSTRLIDKKTASELQAERESWGLVTQMRHDHAPFTVERSNDQFEFLTKMNEDATTNPELVDPRSNLLYVENKAYNWALKEPSLIPFWMHWEKGLPNGGVTPTDDPPWYRQGNILGGSSVPFATVTSVKSPASSPREVLPDYLQKREDRINNLLKNPMESPRELEGLIVAHAPARIQELYEMKSFFEGDETLDPILTADEKREKESLEDIKAEYTILFNSWVGILQDTGVEIRLNFEGQKRSNATEAFYFDDGILRARDYEKLRAREDWINLRLRADNLSFQEVAELRRDLTKFIPRIQSLDERANNVLIAKSGKTKAEYNALSAAEKLVFEQNAAEQNWEGDPQYLKYADLSDKVYSEWLLAFKQNGIKLDYLLPGEIGVRTTSKPPSSSQPIFVHIPWEDKEDPAEAPPPEVQNLETRINYLLYLRNFGKETFTKKEEHELNERLVAVMYPALLLLREKMGDEKKLKEGSKYFENIGQLLINHWVNCLAGTPAIKIRMPLSGPVLDFVPGTLYYRGESEIIGADAKTFTQEKKLSSSPGLFEEWRNEILRARNELAHENQAIAKTNIESDLTPKEAELYKIVGHLQYPALRILDETWRQILTTDPNRKKLRTQWAARFKAWIATFLPDAIVVGNFVNIKRADPDDNRLGDPSFVYYRGALPEIESEISPKYPLEAARRIDAINVLLNTKSSGRVEKERLESLEAQIREFWTPGREHADFLASIEGQKLTEDAVHEKDRKIAEYERRFKELIRILGDALPEVQGYPSGVYEIEDITAEDPRKWQMVTTNDAGLENNINLFKNLLKNRWDHIKSFYRTVATLETNINKLFKASGQDRSLTALESSKLLTYLCPFFPREIEDVYEQLGNIAPYDPEHQEAERRYTKLWGQWTRKLQNYARNNWIKIVVDDGTENAPGSSQSMPGRLYIKPAQNKQRRNKAKTTSAGKSDHEDSKIKMYEQEINQLLQRRNVRLQSPETLGMSWEDNDRLRQLLRLVMGPDKAREDEELRVLDEKSRHTLLQGPELIDFLTRSQIWQGWYNTWIDSFPEEGIALNPLEDDTQRRSQNPGVKFMFVEKTEFKEIDKENTKTSSADSTGAVDATDYHYQLPTPFRGQTMPLHVKKMTQEFNRALRDTPPKFKEVLGDNELRESDVYRKWLPLLMNTYKQQLQPLLLSEFEDIKVENWHPNLQYDGNLPEDVVAQLRTSLAINLQGIWGDLRSVISLKSRKGSIEVFEPVRGELQFRYVPESGLEAADNESVAESDISLTPEPLATVFPHYQEARVEYHRLVHELIDHGSQALLPSVRSQLLQFLKPQTEQQQQDELTEIFVLFKQVTGSDQLSDVQSQWLKETFLKRLWRTYAALSPDLVEREFPELKAEETIETLLERTSPGTLQTNNVPILIPPVTKEEVMELTVDVNNLLNRFKDGTINDNENGVLDTLIRPLANGRLDELETRMAVLILGSTSMKEKKPITTKRELPLLQEVEHLNATESLLFMELKEQWEEEYQEWKRRLPRCGIIVDEWLQDEDAVSIVVGLYRDIKLALKDGPPLSPIKAEFTHCNRRCAYMVFSMIKKFLLDPANFRDEEGWLMLDSLPYDLATSLESLKKLNTGIYIRNQKLSLSELISRNAVEYEFVHHYLTWYNSIPERDRGPITSSTHTHPAVNTIATGGAIDEDSTFYQGVPVNHRITRGRVDFSGKAERRGIQRAAIELALNLLASNQEQHRPHDKFRKLQLPRKYRPPQKDIPLCLPLEPWKRPVEQDPFKITKLLLKYREWKDTDYQKARNKASDLVPGHLAPPMNYNGPARLLTEEELINEVRKRHNDVAGIQAELIEAGRIAPRPLVHRLAMIVDEVIQLPPGSTYPLAQRELAKNDGKEIGLDMKDLKVLCSLFRPSWTKRIGYPPIKIQHERDRLDEFEADVARFNELLPLWEPYGIWHPLSTDPDDEAYYIQEPYIRDNESRYGLDLHTLLQENINVSRKRRAKGLHAVHLWKESEAVNYLTLMHDAELIHFSRGRVSRVPPRGHPEDKYLTSEKHLKGWRTDITFNPEIKQYEVEYDSEGRIGPVTLQPNLYDYLQQIAYRLGREIRELHGKISSEQMPIEREREQFGLLSFTHELLGDIVTDENGVRHQLGHKKLPNRKEISLHKMALDLSRVAPEILQEAQVTLGLDPKRENEQDAAKLLQMELIQEANNNWELQFPVDYSVWDFAWSRRQPQQLSDDRKVIFPKVKFFDMRLWPPCRQGSLTKTAIKNSGLIIQEKPKEIIPQPKTRQQRLADLNKPPPVEQYRGRGMPPFFLFGETPFQEAYQSWRMEKDLEDVEEFNPKPAKPGWFSRKLKVVEELPIDRYALPKIPKGWEPDNVSVPVKTRDVIERVKQTPGFPQQQELYYTPEEIRYLNAKQSWEENEKEKQEAIKLIEKKEGRHYNELTRAQIRAAQTKSGIDPFTEKLIAPTARAEKQIFGIIGDDSVFAGRLPFRGDAIGGQIGAIAPKPAKTVAFLPATPATTRVMRSKSPEKRKASATRTSPVNNRARQATVEEDEEEVEIIV